MAKKTNTPPKSNLERGDAEVAENASSAALPTIETAPDAAPAPVEPTLVESPSALALPEPSADDAFDPAMLAALFSEEIDPSTFLQGVIDVAAAVKPAAKKPRGKGPAKIIDAAAKAAGGESSDDLPPPGVVPILPLRSDVPFPRVIMPLVVSREKGIALIEDVQKSDRTVALATQRDSDTE
ncbi:MAG: LON peptidase substrate-binding domain-containing protein, partial [Planctomycetia bacterium]